MRAHEVKENRKILGQEEVPCEECGKLIHPASLQIHKNNHRRRIRQLNNAEIKTCENCGKAMKAYLLPTLGVIVVSLRSRFFATFVEKKL